MISLLGPFFSRIEGITLGGYRGNGVRRDPVPEVGSNVADLYLH
jgi:hypothetical protein